jgi:hypothetical protein
MEEAKAYADVRSMQWLMLLPSLPFGLLLVIGLARVRSPRVK